MLDRLAYLMMTSKGVLYFMTRQKGHFKNIYLLHPHLSLLTFWNTWPIEVNIQYPNLKNQLENAMIIILKHLKFPCSYFCLHNLKFPHYGRMWNI